MSHVFIAHGGAADVPLAAALQRGIHGLSGGMRGRLSRRGRREVSAMDGQWADVQARLDGADWLVLLASPDSAHSERFGDVVRHWSATRGVQGLLIVVIRGTLVWQDDVGGVDLSTSTAAHPALEGVFAGVPLHMDMTWATDADDLTLRNPRFTQDVARLASPILDKPNDELVGDDVRRQRRTVRRVWATSGLLAVLMAVALVAAGVAVAAADEADRQRLRAEDEQARAQEQERLADEQRAAAEEQRRLSDSRRLAALSARAESEDGSLSRLLALEAWGTAPTAEAGAAVLRATQATSSWVGSSEDAGTARLVDHEGRPVAAEFSPDGSHVATLDEVGDLRIWEVGRVDSPVSVENVGARALAFSGDGAHVGLVSGARFSVVALDGRVTVDVDSLVGSIAALGADRFITGGPAGATVRDLDGGRVAFFDTEWPVESVGASLAGDVIVLQTIQGEIIALDDELQEFSRWTFEPEPQFGRPTPRDVLAVSPDGAAVVLRPDGRGELAPDTIDEPREEQEGVMAAVYATADGALVTPIANPRAYLPVAAPSADFAADGSVVAVSPGGLESPATLASGEPGDGLVPPPLPAGADLVRVSPDGRTLLVAGQDVTATLLESPFTSAEDDDPPDPSAPSGQASVDEEVLMRVCQLAGRNLSEAEWQTYLANRDYEATCETLDAPYVPPGTGADSGGDAAQDAEDEPESAGTPSPEPTPTEQPDAEPSTSELPPNGLADFDFANMAYDRPCGIMDVPSLQDGEVSDFMTQMFLVDVIEQDMDGDGIEDAVLVVDCIDGNAFHLLVWVVDGRSRGEITWIGDGLDLVRSQVSGVEPGRILVDAPVFADGDPQCCPSGSERETYVLAGEDWLVEGR